VNRTIQKEDSMKKKTVEYLYEKKSKNEKMPRTALYDYPMACIAEEAGIDIINVGDSIAMVMLGHENTLAAKLDLMVEHAAAVRRGARSAFIMGDMPFLSYQTSIPDAIRNAGRYMQEAGMDCVKIEGGSEVCDVIRAVTRAGIPVIAHTGLTPQSVNLLGGFKTQGRDAKSALNLINSVLELERAGAIAVVIESVPTEVAKIIYEKIRIPLLGTGVGPYNDSPMINIYDLLGFFDRTPKFAKRYGDIKNIAVMATKDFVNEVKQNKYPGPEHSYKMLDGEYESLLKLLQS
jgi:3-methyl-2-oxobutanoate hydroxymethyltransferase